MPDEEELPEEEHTEEARPIKAVLADLAADWRTKASEARLLAAEDIPFPASHKLHGQADLLEQCADMPLEAIGGREGR